MESLLQPLPDVCQRLRLMSSVQPASPLYADIFDWKSVVTIPSNVPGVNLATDHLQVENDSYFMLMAFLASTNYDNVAGDFIAEVGASPAPAIALVAPPRIPNNFEVMINYNGDTPLMQTPMPQGCLAGNGYMAGRQLPYPMLFPPLTTFDLDFYNVAPTLLQQVDATPIDLQVSFGLFGYYVPAVNLEKFLAAWPAYYEKAALGNPGWLRDFTAMTIPGLT